MNNKNELKLLEFRRASKPAFSSRRRATSLVALASVLVLAMVFSSAGFAAGSSTDPDLERSLEASTLRWVRLGEAYEAARAEAAATAMTDRYKALAAFYGSEAATAVAARNADSDRWVKLGEVYEMARAAAAATAMTNRYKTLAEYCGSAPAQPQAVLCSADLTAFTR